MTRDEIVEQVRLRSLVETTTLTDAHIVTFIDDGNEIVKDYYPWPITINDISGAADSPDFTAGFHWLLASYALARTWEREEYFERADTEFERFYAGLRDMVEFYNGGNT